MSVKPDRHRHGHTDRSGHGVLLAFDITGSGARNRTDDVQLHLRQSLYTVLEAAFRTTHLPWTRCRREDRGDGVLVIPPGWVNAENCLDPLAHHLQAALRKHNKMSSPPATIQLRMAVHAGRVHRDTYGVAGRAITHLYRLLDAPEFRAAFNASERDLGLITSNHLYRETTQHGTIVNPAAYRPITVTCKETRYAHAWTWFPSACR